MQDEIAFAPDYCLGCNRQFVPRRLLVPVDVPPPSPDARRKGTRGLVHGTGRVRANGTIKPAPPVKTRIEIDQTPAPLYCSTECEQRDLAYSSGYDDSQSDDSQHSVVKPGQPTLSTPNTRSMAHLQSLYSMPPLPPATSETYNELEPSANKAEPPKMLEFTSGVMMANRRLAAVLPAPRKPGEAPKPVVPVPGWTDGSQAWRASTYSFAPPPKTRADVTDPNRVAYGTIVATPHRSASGGVVAKEPSSPTTTSYSSSSSSSSSSRNSDMLSSFEDSFTRRTSSRISLYSPSTSPASSVSCSPPRKRSQLSDMLLVPEIMLRPRAGSSPSSASLDSLAHQRSPRRHSAGALPAHSFPGARPRMRSPLSIESTSSDDEDSDADLESVTSVPSSRPYKSQRPQLETRSWSYDNVRTYPVMPLPPVKELRIVDGVETEVEVPRQKKRLFTFAPTVLSRSESASELSA
ncbi:hypothetical protein C8F01DRAFT_1363815 [Mycena amicta]|nr:hypothetical protein C8F01DRAFT_1363815 [Mycena amicta]